MKGTPFHISLIKGKDERPATLTRVAARAVIYNEKGALLMLRSKKGDYKFPGGGVEEGENEKTALKREVMEETGRDVKIGGLLGTAVERRRDFYDPALTFEMVSHYYACTSKGKVGETNLDTYERTLDLKAEWVHPLTALRTNEDVTPKLPWVRRESDVLRRLLDKDEPEAIE